jgi:hypothetical protein
VNDDPVWVFVRGEERLTVRRGTSEDGFVLELQDSSEPRSVPFKDELSLITFQSDMETVLLQTGWSLESFEPDNRTGRDRRSWPRLSSDRRRWWTDGLPKGRRARLFKGVTWLSERMTSKSR